MKLCSCIASFVGLISKLFDGLSHFASVGLRIWMFNVFFSSGLIKIASWNNTLALFEYEYNVTLLPLPPPVAEWLQFESPAFSPVLAAFSGTAGELILPCFLILGLGGRIPVLGLFILNYVAASSYPILWTEDFLAALKDHYIWGLALGFVLFKGHGIFSLDFLLNKKCEKYKY